MPTGYTATLMEKGQTFKEFATQAIRAMGVCIEMRDEPNDAKIPEKFEPSDYHIKALKSARAELKKLEKFSKKEKIAYGQAIIDKTIKYNKEALAKAKKENERLNEMIVSVRSWSIQAGAEYNNLRDFMLDQLNISRNDTSYYEESNKQIEKSSSQEYYLNALEGARHDIDYHIEEMGEEQKRYDDKNKYLSNFRKSLEKM